jgi:hypothetical protein
MGMSYPYINSLDIIPTEQTNAISNLWVQFADSTMLHLMCHSTLVHRAIVGIEKQDYKKW